MIITMIKKTESPAPLSANNIYEALGSRLSNNNDNNNELCHLYPYPCPKKFYKLPAALFRCTNLFYKLAWAWAWV